MMKECGQWGCLGSDLAQDMCGFKSQHPKSMGLEKGMKLTCNLQWRQVLIYANNTSAIGQLLVNAAGVFY